MWHQPLPGEIQPETQQNSLWISFFFLIPQREQEMARSIFLKKGDATFAEISDVPTLWV